MQSLQRNGYVRKVNENQFLITPKGISKAQRLAKELVVFEKSKWDGKWYFVIFDVPDSKENQRNLFRATLKRMGFVGLQKSVFIAPFANFQKVAVIRDELGIAEYVTFFEGRASSEDDDDKLRKKFGLT
jgi:phenylacetic acid degradation operon negative regulatory protein